MGYCAKLVSPNNIGTAQAKHDRKLAQGELAVIDSLCRGNVLQFLTSVAEFITQLS